MSKVNGKFIDDIWAQASATGDGATTAFVLPAAPQSSTAVQVHLNGRMQKQGGSDDYTISGSTITFNTAPAIAQQIDILFIKKEA